MPNHPREGYRSANKPDDDDVEGHGPGGLRNAPDEDDVEGHGPGGLRNAPDEEDTEGHGGPGGQLRYRPEGYRSAATPDDEDTEGHGLRSPASRGE